MWGGGLKIDDCKRTRINIELRSLSNITMRYIDNHSHKKFLDSITGTNGWILGVIAANPDKDIFQKDLEDAFGVTRSTVSKVINLMEQKGLIERSPVDYDARLKKLSLTPKSKELIGYMVEDNEKMEALLTGGFTQEEKAQLLSYIKRMKNNLKEAMEKTDGKPITELK